AEWVEVSKALPHILGLRALDAPRKAVRPALRIDRHEVAPVAARETPPLLFERRLKRLPVVGRAPKLRHQFLGLLRTDARPLALLHLLVARRAFGPRLPVPFDMRPLHAGVSEF